MIELDFYKLTRKKNNIEMNMHINKMKCLMSA